MDIVLEVCDTFFFDRIYSSLVPISSSPFFSKVLNNTISSTYSSISEAASASAQKPWAYKPASRYISFQPSQYAYSSAWPRDNIYRQMISFFAIIWIFGLFIYFVCASLSYIFVFDKETVKHPKFLKNQISMEIAQAASSLPVMAIMTAPIFVAEVRGHAKLYDTSEDAPFPAYNWLQFPIFILFTDFCIYFIHRGLHHPLIYKHIHKPHHKWIVPTPYASHAFHPLDGYAQGLPYHLFPFIFPLQKWAYVLLFFFVNIWTIFIHDGEYVANSPIINGAACHTLHHTYFNFNYGQYTTLWDRLCGSYRQPNEELFNKETKLGKEEWARQTKETEKILKEVEGDDDRQYDHPEGETKKTL